MEQKRCWRGWTLMMRSVGLLLTLMPLVLLLLIPLLGVTRASEKVLGGGSTLNGPEYARKTGIPPASRRLCG